eukprot:CAMPEP_0172725686 /NCGR_PEP_ID=MMETSP1074-20121228/88996_1 /TAXON_ID=2916 /ORGANISM="Ceratium fusus, Strain PA161109" /LENGTH=139 /DNA_ID=CAMNT_0013552519 /DNA_START=70 /DNA_END=489 /DNA_ORIENTATION=-
MCHAEGGMLCCNAGDGEEVRPLPLDMLTTDEGTAVIGDELQQHPSKVPVSLHQLQGKWNRQADGMPMGEVKGSTVEWDMSYQHAPSKLSMVTGLSGVPVAADVEMELAGEKHWARYETGNRPQLIWTDGEVWVKPLNQH